MIKSMTGFGKAQAEASGKTISVEIRALNSKQMDLSLKMPAAYRAFDPDIRAAVSRSAQRGKVDVYVACESVAAAGAAAIDGALFDEYYARLGDIARRNGVKWGGEVVDAQVIPAILRMPDVVGGSVQEASEEEGAALTSAVARALEELEAFRINEGATLLADILSRVDGIESLLTSVAPYEAGRADAVRKRIREHLESLEVKPDDNRLEQEMIFYIEKFDITEEKVRLARHCEYFREVAGAEEAPGRKLGFIAQEMGREINTLGSKANNSDIQKIVVQMKDELEKIKEQLLNIL